LLQVLGIVQIGMGCDDCAMDYTTTLPLRPAALPLTTPSAATLHTKPDSWRAAFLVSQTAEPVRSAVEREVASSDWAKIWLTQLDAMVCHASNQRLQAMRLYYDILAKNIPAALQESKANQSWRRLGRAVELAATAV
jgi:hypothetical protein